MRSLASPLCLHHPHRRTINLINYLACDFTGRVHQDLTFDANHALDDLETNPRSWETMTTVSVLIQRLKQIIQIPFHDNVQIGSWFVKKQEGQVRKPKHEL